MPFNWLRSLARILFRRERMERELDEEIRSYAGMLADEKTRGGVPPEEAMRAARIEAGGIEQVKEQVREARSGAWIDALVQDLSYGVRILRRSPGFTGVTVLMLALAIGANTALFSIVHALLLRSLPYREADKLVYVSEFWPNDPRIPAPLSPDFANWRSQSRLIEDIEAYGDGGAFNLTGGDEPERVQGTMVTAGFLDLIGVLPAIGRNFTAEEDRLGAEPTVVLSDGLWRRRFGASFDIIGKPIQLDGISRTVVGVLPPSFVFPDNSFRADLLVPMMLPVSPSWQDERNLRLLRVMARPRAGVTPEALRTEFAGIVRRAAAEEPPHWARERRGMEVRVTPQRKRLSGEFGLVILVLQAAVAMVLLIACLNVANLQIARATSRKKEMALRAALGAGRARLTRQMLTESLLLGLTGGGSGLLLGYWSIGYLRTFLPANLHLANTVSMDGVVLAFTLAIAITAGVLTGLAPVLAISRAQTNEVLKEGSGRATQSGRHRLQGTLIVAEVAMAIVLLAGSGLLIRSFLKISALDPGFDPDGVLTLRISLPDRKYATPDRRIAFFSDVLERARAIPGVYSVAVASSLPLTGTRSGIWTWVEGRPVPPDGARPTIPIAGVSSEYFSTLRIPLLRGRALSDADREGTHSVVVVNQAFADQFFPGENAIGKRIMVPPRPGSGREIVGIAGNVRQQGFQTPAVPTIYAPYRQFPEPEMLLILRSDLSAASLTSSAIDAVQEVDPNQPVHDIATMEERIGDALSTYRANMMLMGIFAALALTLATIGVFGVIAYFVSRSSHEIAIRMALGARSSDVLKMVLGRGMALTVAGMVLGTAGALAATRFLRSLLFDISPTDPLTFASIPMLFACVAGVACYLPARWATKVDPMVTLRHE